MTNLIHILCGADLPQDALKRISQTVTALFGMPAITEPLTVETEKAFDDSRGQYHSTTILGQLLTAYTADDEKYIAIVDADLFIPVLTFVFGEAQFDGQAAIVSTRRLKNTFYGMPEDDQVFFQRLEKEIVHELGHTFGLYHCHQFECVMRSSTCVEEIDLKLASFCSMCSASLHQHDTTNVKKGIIL